MSRGNRPEHSAGSPSRLSRTLLFPGPIPPHSHLGVTLLRHVVATGLRSALHRLGLPLISSVPVRIVELRLYLDRGALARELGDRPDADEAVAALIDPAGTARPSAGGARLAGAGLIHRARLWRRRSPRLPVQPGSELVGDFLRRLSALLPALSDAFLAELLSSLARRRARATGRQRPPCLGREAWRFHTGQPVRLECLGPPEPLLPSWASATLPPSPTFTPEPPPRARYRGRFREQYRAALDLLAASYRRVAESATERGLLDDPSDAFFLPLDLAEDLAADHRPPWLATAIAANRHEYMTHRTIPSPPDLIDPDSDTDPSPDAWDLSCLHPMP